MAALADYLDHLAEPNAPLIVAGDFNDWRNRAGENLSQRLGLQEVFSGPSGKPVCSFPAARPMFRLDRIYVRGFKVDTAEVLHGPLWARLSDHAPIVATLKLA